jgi:hypothetical protein
MSVAVYTNSTLEEIKQELYDMGCPVGSGEDSKQQPIKRRDDDENMEEDDDQMMKNNKKKKNKNEQQRSASPLLQVTVLDAQTHGAWNDYPVNELRNLALSKVQTTYILYIDVDFWPSQDLYETVVTSSEIKQTLLDDPKHALVVPAFQLLRQCHDWIDCRDKNIPKMPHDLDGLATMIKKKRGTIFDFTNRGGHGSTDYKKWVAQTPGSLHRIDCLQSHRYEPFVMIRYCHDMPPFQSAFSGYGKNKVTWMMQVVASGYTLSQVGGTFLVHYPHLDSQSRQHWNEAPKELQIPGGRPAPGAGYFNLRRPDKADAHVKFDSYKRGQVDKLFLQFKDWLSETIPPDRARLDLCENAQDDDSKLWINPVEKESRKKQQQQQQQQQ